MERRLLYQPILAFFGLTFETAPQIRLNLFTQIHEIILHGGGGYDWNTIYNLPIWLRKFIFHKLKEYHKPKESDLAGQTENIKSGKIELPPHLKNRNIKVIPRY